MRMLTLAWVVEALSNKSPLFIGCGESKFRAALRRFIVASAPSLALLERRVKRLEQFHCEHEFSDPRKGCLESIFCSKCGALHPDWEHCGGMALPTADDAVWVGDKLYAPKRKEKP